MSTAAGATWYVPDPRANRLASWTATAYNGGHVLWLRGPVAAARQILMLAPQYQLLPTATTAGSAWTHALQSPETGVNAEVNTLLTLLTEVLTLQRYPNLDFGITLDWYKIPDDSLDSHQWANTAAGELVTRGKYWYKNRPELQRQVGLELVGNMCNAISRHGVLNRVAVILDVPGHDSDRLSFGSRVASTVASRHGKPMIRVAAKSEFRPEAKGLSRSEREEVLRDQFMVSDEVKDKAVLIVDDVYQSGTSMGEVAKAARQSGALRVFGFCAARTLSN